MALVKLKKKIEDGDLVTNDSLLDAYAKRAKYSDSVRNIMTLNFVTFATKYKVVNKQLRTQAQNTLARIFPVYSSNPKGPNFALYCKYQLLTYKPWHTTQNNAWDDEPGTDPTYITKWKEFLQSSYAKEHVPDWHEKLHVAQNYSEGDTDIGETVQQFSPREEWMLLADLIPGSFETEQSLHSEYTWQNDNVKYTESEIREMPSWLKTAKTILDPGQVIVHENIDVNTFSDMQGCAYNIIKNHLENRSPTYPLLLIIIGVAGTGKRYLINAIRNLLQQSCAVTCHDWKSFL